MKFQKNNQLNDKKFLRLTAIKRITFNKMLEILKIEELKKKFRRGRNNKLSLESRLLMTLEYWREYRTYFHIAKSYDISESSCYRNIKWIEDTLFNKTPCFSTTWWTKITIKRRFQRQNNNNWCNWKSNPTPKKRKKSTTQEKRKNIPSKHSL